MLLLHLKEHLCIFRLGSKLLIYEEVKFNKKVMKNTYAGQYLSQSNQAITVNHL